MRLTVQNQKSHKITKEKLLPIILIIQEIIIQIIILRITNPNYQKFNNINQNIEYRKNSLKHSSNNDEDIQELTKKLADLNINLCINCQRIGHLIDDCPELEEQHLN